MAASCMQCTFMILTWGALIFRAFATVPRDLSNWQSEYACDARTRIVRPNTVQDVQDAVKYHTEIRPNGFGHSWNQPFFCADPDVAARQNGTAANIQLGTIRPLSIDVNETDSSVTVDAGVMVYDLLNYLSNYVTKTAPLGWTLPAFPWFTYQTIGGAVATATHGSSLQYASLSHQVIELTMVLANGTIRTFSSASDPFLMKAVRVSVGKLGVITSLKLMIVKETAVQRTLTSLTPTQMLSLLHNATLQYRTTGRLPSWCNESEMFWVVQKQQFFMVSYLRADEVPSKELGELLGDFQPDNTTLFPSKWLMYRTLKAAAPSSESEEAAMAPAPDVNLADVYPLDTDNVPLTPQGVTMKAQDELDEIMRSRVNAQPKWVDAFDHVGVDKSVAAVNGTAWPPVKPLLPSAYMASPEMVEGYMEANEVVLRSILKNASVEARQAYATQPITIMGQMRSTLYDQYEVAMPVDHMDECVKGLLNLIYKGDLEGKDPELRKTDKGFRTAPLFRFVGQEDSLLADTHDGPRLYINLEDYYYYNSGNETNKPFKAAMGYLRSNPACGSAGRGARLHWGKAGWPDKGCWHGDEEFPDSWCDFGCASQALDPDNKFVGSAGDRWTWEGVDLARCCTPQGFNKSMHGCECKVKHQRQMKDCPPAPHYTYR